MTRKKLALYVSLISLIIATPVFAAEPWPGEVWTDSTILTQLDSDFQNNLSGAHWNETTRTLWVCLNGPGKFWAITEDGNGGFEIDSQNGHAAEWNAPGDLEGITQVDLEDPSVYVIAENEGIIRKYDVSVYGSAILERAWNISAFIPAYNGSSGPEGITFVPDEWLVLNGFVDANGQPYVSQNGMGGLMFVAHQNGGGVYAFDLDPASNALDFVGMYKTSRGESSGLEFDRSSGKLYIWHNTGSNFIEITDLTSYIAGNGQRTFSSIKEYTGPKGGNLEGIALSPASSEDAWFFTTDDDNQQGAALMWFQEFEPEVLGNDHYTVYQGSPLEVSVPGLLQNDLGTDTLVLVEGPAHGTLEGLQVGDEFDGSFVYHANPQYSGSDFFTYSAVNGQEVAKVAIDIKAIQTLTKSVAASMDDVEERADGTMYTNSSDLELVHESTIQTVGIKFNSIDIPEGATIVNAYIQFTTDETKNEAGNLIIEGDATANSLPFNSSAHNVSQRARTAASVSWSPELWSTINESAVNQRTPNLTPIIEEILQTPGWIAGNDMTFIISGSGKRVARSYDYSPALAPRLVIEYVDDNAIPMDPEMGSVDIRISSGMDDVEERANGSMYTNSTDLEMVTDGNTQTVGMRFMGVDIPAGAEITRASIQFAVDETSNENTQLTLSAEKTANAPAFSTTAYDVSNRLKTNAQVAWSPEAWNAVGEAAAAQQTPDLTAVVQEVIDNPGWHSGHALVFIVEGSGKRVAESYDGSPLTAPLLHIEYRGANIEEVEEPMPTTGSFDVRISSGMSDVEERADGSMYTNSTDLEMVTDAGEQTVGMRFEGLNIPVGAEITSASIQFAVDETSNVNTQLTIAAENSGNAAAFSTAAYNLSDRAQTNAQVAWAPEAWNVVGQATAAQQTPDLSALLQEVVDRQDWQTGQAMVFIVQGSGKRVAESFEGSAVTAPLLHVEYRQ